MISVGLNILRSGFYTGVLCKVTSRLLRIAKKNSESVLSILRIIDPAEEEFFESIVYSTENTEVYPD
jgi:hypothetical protein